MPEPATPESVPAKNKEKSDTCLPPRSKSGSVLACQNSQTHNLNRIFKDQFLKPKVRNTLRLIWLAISDQRAGKCIEIRNDVKRTVDDILEESFLPQISVVDSLAPIWSRQQSIDSHSDRANRKKTRGKIRQNTINPGNSCSLAIPAPNRSNT
jgi:hypothetical protein